MTQIISIFFLLAFVNINAQTVISSCSAPDSVIKKYKKDADGLAVWRVAVKINSSYTDSATIDPILRASYLNALLAVYNATALPARDTVVNFLHIHRYRNILNSFYINADSNLFWMQNLRNNIIPTGKSSLDSLISKYFIQKTGYYANPFFSYHTVTFSTDTNCNMFALSTNFNNLVGANAYPEIISGDGSDITDSINVNFIELTYKFGWGDCGAGCINRRYWKFRVYNNCSVEYKGSYGSPIHYVGLKAQYITDSEIKVYPNPVSDKFIIENNNADKLIISNCLGQTVYVLNDPAAKQEIDMSAFLDGVYFLRSGNKIFKIVKEE